MFSMVKAINSMKRKEEAAPATPTPTKEELLLTEIRDLLKNRPL
ncbi:MAG: Large-conductance mechanosensitive channel [uncultured Adhaeribacter sp.]|uniref:Large-conductance mechanosensitive channel n=1 Tax=uncultured Adhaeribacter sp. TaxID=448109 RepID=A0A6J4IY95_9BACT|nr:MAG: Large-conductance mechanosensitive channel [uncultured Adhaeribacter sp.]